jgi:dihydrofolate synthase/folylpolyglutamate synthase
MDPRAWLFSLEQFGIKLGLDTMTAMLEPLGNPHRSFTSIHVAGTNGKGSVTAMVDQALREAGHRSARYTSPHLMDVTERFAIDGRPVPDAALDAAIARIRQAVESLQASRRLSVTPTFFEVTTAAAFDLFARAGATIAVCETGLGGRLDATNVLQPAATAITTIALDHQQHLGDTLDAIAREKAGIIKDGIPIVLGPLPAEAFDVVAAVAERRQARVVQATREVQAEPQDDRVAFQSAVRRYGPVRLGLAGRHQVHNAQVAIALLEVIDRHGVAVPAEAVARGLERVQWPGRLEWRRLPDGREALLDAAHNPEGAAALAGYLNERPERLPLVFGAMSDKDAAGILRHLLPVVAQVICTRASSPRAADPAALADLARRISPDHAVSIAESPAAALADAWRHSPRVIVAGSIFLLGDVYAAFEDRR